MQPAPAAYIPSSPDKDLDPDVVAALDRALVRKPTLQKVHYSHDAMIDCIIANPIITQTELGKIFDRTPAWVSIITNSDAFKTRLAARKADLIDTNLILTARERFEAVVTKSTEVMMEKLSKPVDQIADSTVLKAMEIGAKAIGVGGNAPPAPPQGDYLPALAQRLTGLLRGSREVIEDANFTLIEDRTGVRAERGESAAEASDASLRG